MKVAILDLDNTLWGGVIGDEGLKGIQLGNETPSGEAYSRFQAYLLELKNRGVVLAVCSKNDFEQAILPFRSHPGMLLKQTDISCFMANWNPKDRNIVAIAEQLNLGLNSFVFFDDSPSERELIRKSLPDVSVVEPRNDPSFYIRDLDEGYFFETIGLSREDEARTQLYFENNERKQNEVCFFDHIDFLKGLEMEAILASYNEHNLLRVVQLINKTNQFNLTTRRYGQPQLEEQIKSKNFYSLTISLSDKFGNYGLISAIHGHLEHDSLHIDLWVMSCRALQRGVEILAIQEILNYCDKNQISYVHGIYIPTSKNLLVKDHYKTLGFISANSSGSFSMEEKWVCDIRSRDFSGRTYISVRDT